MPSLRLIATVASTGVAGTTVAQAEFLVIGDLPGGQNISNPSAISADGSVVAGEGFPEVGVASGYRWSETTGMAEIPRVPGGAFFDTSDVSPNGEWVVGTYTRPSGGGALSYAWSEATGTVFLPRPDDAFGAGIGVMNADGSIIIGAIDNDPVIWFDQGEPILFDDYLDQLELEQLGRHARQFAPLAAGQRDVAHDTDRLELLD